MKASSQELSFYVKVIVTSSMMLVKTIAYVEFKSYSNTLIRNKYVEQINGSNYKLANESLKVSVAFSYFNVLWQLIYLIVVVTVA